MELVVAKAPGSECAVVTIQTLNNSPVVLGLFTCLRVFSLFCSPREILSLEALLALFDCCFYSKCATMEAKAHKETVSGIFSKSHFAADTVKLGLAVIDFTDIPASSLEMEIFNPCPPPPVAVGTHLLQAVGLMPILLRMKMLLLNIGEVFWGKFRWSPPLPSLHFLCR